MNARLVRASSSEPTIRSFDDAVMARYAYGGNGIVKSFGEELAINVDTYAATINTGRVVLHGWEVDVQSPITLGLSLYESGVAYIYLEIDLAIESAEFKVLTMYGGTFEESLSLGDDLTKNPFGKARLPIYSFNYEAELGSIFNEKYLVTVLDPGSKTGSLGFTEGTVTLVGSSALNPVGGTNWLKRQGNLVVGSLNIANVENDFPDDSEYSGRVIGILPEGFKPSSTTIQPSAIAEIHPNMLSTDTIAVPVALVPNGKIFVSRDVTYIFSIELVLGYEAEPIK